MMYLIFALIFMAYLYFGYRDDYRKDNINFKMTVFGIFGMLLTGIFTFFVWSKLEKPIRKAVSVHYEKALGLRKEGLKEDIAKIDLGKLRVENSKHNAKVDSVMGIFELLVFLLAYLIIFQYNKFLKKRFISNSQKA